MTVANVCGPVLDDARGLDVVALRARVCRIVRRIRVHSAPPSGRAFADLSAHDFEALNLELC